MASPLTPGQRTFAQHLAALTGLNSRAISAWMLAEESGGAARSRQAQHNNNWLNIGYFDSGPGAITKDQAFRDPVRAAQYTADFLKGRRGGAAPGIRAILHTAGQGPEQQLQAIAASPWASSHYGGAGRLVSLLKSAPAPGAASGMAAPASSPSPRSTVSRTRTITTTTPGVDNRAARAALISSFLEDHNADPVNFAVQANALKDIAPTSSTRTVRLPGSSAPSQSGPSHSGSASASFSTPKAQSGVVNFDGKKVAAWIAPALQYARRHGWSGQVNSGYRSFADQQRIYNSGVRPAARPGTSNHEGSQFPRGAVDVSDAQQLARILARSPYGGRLKWAGAKDPVHFSHPHNGGY